MGAETHLTVAERRWLSPLPLWTCTTQRVDVLHGISVRARFMAILGISTSVLFAMAIVAGSFPRWVLDACQ